MKRNKKPPRAVRILFRAAGWAAGLGVVLLIVALVVVLTAGLPGEWTDQMRTVLREAGVPLEFNRIRLSKSGRGWILDHVKFYGGSPDQLKPLFAADEAAVHLLPRDWRNLRSGGWIVRMTVCDVQFHPPGISLQQIGAGHSIRRIDRMEAAVRIDPQEVRIEPSQILWGEVQIDLAGSVVRRDEPVKAAAFSVERVGEWTAWLLERLELTGEASLNARFHVDPAHIEQAEIHLDVALFGLSWEGRLFGPIESRLRGNGSELSLDYLQIGHASGGELTLHGRIETASRETQVHAVSTLPAEVILNGLPDPLTDLMKEHAIRITGRPVLKADIGPAPVNRLHEWIDASADEVELEIGAFRFTPGSLQAALRGIQLNVHTIQAEVEGHPLAGAFRIDLENLSWECDVDAQCNPQFAGLFDEDLDEFLSHFSFQQTPPTTKLFLSQERPGDALRIDGTISGEQFEWSGVPISRAQTSLNYAERVLTLDPLAFSRDGKEAYLEGELTIRFPEKKAQFDARGAFPPAELARIIHPEYPTALDQLTFNGPVELSGRGTVDYGERTGQDFVIEASGTRIGWNAIETGPFRLDVHGAGEQLILTNATASIWGGTTEANGWFLWTGDEEHSPYQIRARLNDADVARMAAMTTGQDVQRVRGTLNGHLDLTADAAKEFWASAQGKGRVVIRNGHLADLPILGGFARLIQTTIPAFRFFSLTTLAADFELRDAAVHSSSVELGGTLISAEARGVWSPVDGLDFVVRAEPLRQTRDDKSWYQVHLWAADVLKTGTSPFFRMLEMRLDGTLDDPVWRLAALPDEVRDVFRRQASE